MNYPNIPEYRLDITGKNPENLIPFEHLQREDNDRKMIVVPRHAPFFIDSVILSFPDGTPMVYGTHYEFFNIMGELSRRTGKAVGCFIRILDKTITRFNARYQTVGSVSLFDKSFLDLYNTVIDDERAVWFDDIANKPILFDPEQHGHDVRYGVYAFKDLADAFEQMVANTVGGEGYHAPYEEFFVQRINNAISYLSQVQSRCIALINEHASNKINVHGIDNVKVGLGNVDNIGTYTSDNWGDPIDDKHRITPGYLKKLAENTTVDLSNLVQPGVLPIARYGENFYIPPVIDGSFKGVGTRQPWRVACLERNGYLVAIGNYKDVNTDVLMYMYNKTPFVSPANSANWINTRYEYKPTRAVEDNVKLTTVIKGGDYRWMIVGNDQTNKWYVVNCNSTFNPVSHVLTPISNVDFFSNISHIRMAVCGESIYLFKITDTQADGRKYVTMRKIDVSSVDVNTESVALTTPSLIYTDSSNASKTSTTGVFDPFVVTKDGSNKVTKVLGSFSPVLDYIQMERDIHIEMIPDPTNPTVSYMRWWTPCMHHLGTKTVTTTYSPSWKLQESGGFTTMTWTKGLGSATMNITAWDLNYAPWMGNQNTANTAFFQQTSSWFHSPAMGNGFTGSSSILSNDARFSCASTHWNFFPLLTATSMSDFFTSSDPSTFTTADPAITNMDVNEAGGYNLRTLQCGITNTTVYGSAPASSCHSTLPFTEANNSITHYELIKSEVNDDTFVHTAKLRTGDRTTASVYDANTYYHMSYTNDIYKTNIPPRGVRVSYVDEMNAANKGETFFSVTGGTVYSLGTGLQDNLLTHSFTTTRDSSTRTLSFNPSLYVQITNALVLSLVTANFPNAAAYYQKAWTLLWVPGKESIIAPMLIVEWMGTSSDTNAYIGVMTLNVVKNPTLTANQTATVNGVKTCVMNVGDLTVANKYTVTNGTYSGDRSWFDAIGNHYINSGYFTVYRNASGEVSFYWGSTNSKNYGSATSYGVAKTAYLSGKMSGPTVISAINNYPGGRDMLGSVVYALKGVGLLLISDTMSNDIFVGGGITPAKLAGNTYQSVLDGYANTALLGSFYIVADIIPVNQWTLFFSASKIVLKGTYFELPVGTLSLTDYFTDVQNKTFYLFLKLTEGSPVYELSSTMLSETSTCMLIATITTDALSIVSVDTQKVFSMTGYRVSSQAIGSIIPGSTGGINELGETPWLSSTLVD